MKQRVVPIAQISDVARFTGTWFLQKKFFKGLILNN